MALINTMSADMLTFVSPVAEVGWINSSSFGPYYNNSGTNRGGRTYIQASNGTLTGVYPRPPAAGTTVLTSGFAFSHQNGRPSDGGSNSDFFSPQDINSTASLFTVGYTFADNGLTLKNGSDGVSVSSVPNIFTKVGGVFPNQPWYFIEISWSYGSSTSTTVTVRVDGVAIISGQTVTSSINSNLVAKNKYYYGNVGSNGFMDFYTLDNTGTTNTTFLGDCRVEYLTAASNGANQQWSLGAGATKLAAIQTNNGDASYVRSTNLNEKDSYVMTDLVSTSGVVRAVQVQMIAKQDSTAPQTMNGLVRLGGINYVSTDGFNPPQGVYRLNVGTFDVSPATTTTWTASEVNSLEAGMTITA